MKKILTWLVLIIGLSGYSLWYIIHNKTVAEIPLKDYTLEVRVGNPLATVREKARSLWASVAINGSFYCPAEKAYSYCGADNSTSSDRIVNGVAYSKYPNDTGERGILGVTKEGKALFVQNNHWQWYMANTNQDRLGEMRNGIGNFPILLDKWVDVTTEFMHLIDDKMFKKWTRSFICTPESADTIFMGFVPNKSMYEMGKYLKETYNCYFAINLDAWASSAMLVDDKYVVGPWRKVVDGFVAVPKPAYIENKIQNYKLSQQQKDGINYLSDLFIYEAHKQGESYKQKTLDMLNSFETSKRLYPLADKRAIIRAMIQKIQTAEIWVQPWFIPYE